MLWRLRICREGVSSYIFNMQTIQPPNYQILATSCIISTKCAYGGSVHMPPSLGHKHTALVKITIFNTEM